MMELSHSLTLNEDALNQIPEAKRPVFVFEWLRFLDKVLVAAQKNDIKGCQQKLVEQLTRHMQGAPGPPTRRLIARCLATLFSVGDTFLLFDTVNKCNDILKNKDDSPSFLPTKLAAICCVGCMYEKLGRMMGRSYEDTVQILIKSLRSAESQTRIEIMHTLEKVCAGMGSAITNVHKEIYKVARHCLTDRVMAVRCAAAKCLLEMLNHAPFLCTTEIESVATLCFRAFEGSNYEVRCTVAKLLGALVATTQQATPKGNNPAVLAPQSKGYKPISLDEALNILMSGFLRGGAGFLKGTGEMIKGSSGVNREVRVGVTHAYVVFVQILGGAWLERNISTLVAHVLDLVANPKAASSHVDAVYSRKCINFILRGTIGKLLGEGAQAAACKEIAHVILKQMNSIDFSPENAKDCNQETLFSQHLLVCALQEMGNLILGLGTTACNLISDQSLSLIETTIAVLVHPCQAARLAASWCLRCICVAVPSQITPLIDRCVDAIENMRSSPEAIAGYSSALAAVLGSVRLSPLGVPHTKGKIIFNTAEELLRSASQNSRLSLNRTHAGWLLIGAIMTLGVAVVRGLLPRMLLLWRNSFPRSNKELESEKARGDAFTWQVTLEGRAGALSAMHSFLLHCSDLLNDDITRRLLTPIESALAMLTNLSTVLKNYGQQLKAPAAMVRLRLYETLLLLPPQTFEGSYTHLLRMLVSEFTLTENPGNTTTSLLRIVCHADDSVILGTWLQETDHRTIEDQMEPNRRADSEHLQPNSAAGSGALEHDSCCLYRPVPTGEIVPGPLPLGVAVIDMSVSLFGQIFPRVANKHRLQMLDHFSECIKHAKSARQEAVQMNVFTAVLSGLKGLNEAKTSFGQEDVKKSATNLIIGALVSSNSILRCAAGEAVGRMAQVVSDSKFTAELAQTSFDRLKSARDVASRTGHSLALGCLHRYVGGMGSSQHLNTSVSILLALAQDNTSPVVQVWALHALALIADSGGPMFRGYVEPTLSLALTLLLNVPHSYIDVHQCIGKVLSALITTIGPELQGNTSTICMARSSFLCACAIMQDHQDPLVQAEATGCLQQLHLFAPRHVNLSSLVPTLCRTLSSNHLLLRKAAISCLRQLAQREAKEVCEHAMTLANESRDTNIVEGLVITETGLPGVLFSMLDTETDSRLIKDIHDTLTSMLQMLAADNLSQWLSLCKDVLTVASESSTTTEEVTAVLTEDSTADDEGTEAEGDDDQAEFHAEESTRQRPAVSPRWPTRVFAAQSVRRIITACLVNKQAHFDLALAKEMQLTRGRGDFLVLHLSDLVRMAFMAATSDCDPLRLEGLKTLQEIIDKFAKVPEPEFPGHLLLEQFQAQVGAALRPAFSTETASHVTAAACEACSAWIGSGVARDLNDLRRVHQLLVSSLEKLRGGHSHQQLYNESLSTLEKLAILKAWAEVYVVAMINDGSAPGNVETSRNKTHTTAANEEEGFGEFEFQNESLLSLVQPELLSLSQHWLAALRDHALLSLPPEFSSQLPHDGGAFYTTDTMESARPYYLESWAPILHAATLWLNARGFESPEPTNVDTNTKNKLGRNNNNDTTNTESNVERFHLLFGICMEALCSPRSSESTQSVETCLSALYTLLDSIWARNVLMVDRSLPIELCNVLHRLLLTRESYTIQMMVMEVLKQVMRAAQEDLADRKKSKLKELVPANQESKDTTEVDVLGEGQETGDLIPGQSLVFAVLEVCLCLLVRQIPALNPSPGGATTVLSHRGYTASEECGRLIAAALNVMEGLPRLCSPQGAIAILPTLLYLTTGVIRETAIRTDNDNSGVGPGAPVHGALHCLKSLMTDKYATDARSEQQWKTLLQSALAKIVDLAKTGCDETKMDEVAMMLGIAVFVLHASPEVVSAPNLQYPCINHFRQCIQSENTLVKLKCIQTLRTIFMHPERSVSTPYIHALAPRLVEYLYSESSKQVSTETQLTLTLESIATIEALISLAEPANRDLMQGIQMLTLLVPILINYLLEGDALHHGSKFQITLHQQSFQWLNKIGPKYPQEFKTLMAQSTELKTKLENAVRSSHQQQVQKQSKLSEPMKQAIKLNTAPSIKLKTDFSNFN
ncbi:HEAT repeat-containing protein 5B isoform X2 [Diprion similis]|uniref:HEAT repeat-containing protein 5B isoform X2 n=1 Tax=Diprion similis TaxID=362088 RepID=UPI001EF7BD2B|nr:HEAT repeat-containing protein 5B isoform X2 [Diprion similis]XP_046742188.1 HEAT repeat-containing protein 5B isoform X2 [Diprion similis]XP_046742189.1 HEAT repeat-containing protein 5B isoform X2 [Diprion similis]XP_046742190.1 HEAT repeat-containing protein 5B isoform X2 [Diprion similis]XP_046742191.1 HEAT repeat-containing protein 5B isoform X2 [Diprion similis]